MTEWFRVEWSALLGSARDAGELRCALGIDRELTA
jgi:hypothetical protein